MKNICIFIAIVLVLLCSLCSCADPSSEPGDTPLENPGTDTVSTNELDTTSVTTDLTNTVTFNGSVTTPIENPLPAEIDDLRAVFFTKTNTSGKCTPYYTVDEDGNPYAGGLPAIHLTPKYEKRTAYAGQSTTLRVDTPKEHGIFLYYVRNDDGTERLLAYVDGNVPLLIGFSLEVGGVEEFVGCIKEGTYMPVTVMDAVNIHDYEGDHLFVIAPTNAPTNLNHPKLLDYSGREEAVTVPPDATACLVVVIDGEMSIWDASEKNYFTLQAHLVHKADRYGLQY